MATQFLERNMVDLSSSRRSLLLVWQNPNTRQFLAVGQLDALDQGRFAFRYLENALADDDFQPLVEFPETGGVYVSDELPAFFANRVLSQERSNYGAYLQWLGIDSLGEEDVPLEVLVRTGGGRATDTFHVLDVPTQTPETFVSRFFVSGIRHVDSVGDVLASVKSGDRLQLELEEANPVNPKAVLVDSADGRKIGYVPDWLCAEVHRFVKDGWEVTAVAERVNHDAPAHVRLLCRIEARSALLLSESSPE
ncbi:MAG: hypothetical protein KF867_02360 [Cryobacterium sp.]|nr:hypothetical protein [Cryobacterium sp.]